MTSSPPNDNEFPAVSWSEPPGRDEDFEKLPQIKGYEIVKKLGEGGMGIVYLAEQKEPVRRRVALKVIKPGMDSSKVIARFEAERQALAMLDHPNIAKVFDAGTTELGRPYFAMEYIEGMRITDYCDLMQFSIEERLELIVQVCLAIQHAHQKGIIHRDIKPSNILVSVQNEQRIPKVIDFGVAKALSQQLTERTMFTEKGQLIGTPEYMSPEQADAAVQDIDTRSDIYSLGVLLYELLTGSLPFDPETLRQAGLAEIQRIIREEKPPRPSTKLSSLGDEARDIVRNRQTELASLIRQLHKELEWIPLKAMRKERTHRYQSALELANDIRNYISGAPLIAGPESRLYRIKKFAQRNRGLVAAVIAIAFSLSLGLIVSTKSRIDAVQQRNRAEHHLEVAERSLYFNQIALAYSEYKGENTLRVKQLLQECPEDLRGWEYSYLNRIVDSSILTFKGHEGRVSVLSFTPDVNRIMSFSPTDETVRIWDVKTGSECSTATLGPQVTIVDFSPNGKHMAVGYLDKTIKLWDIEEGKVIKIFKGHKDTTRCIKFAPKGDRIAAAACRSGGLDPNIRIWDVITGEEISSIEYSGVAFSHMDFSPDGNRLATTSYQAPAPTFHYELKVWDVFTGKHVVTLDIPAPHESPRGISHLRGIEFDNTGNKILTANWNQAWVWDAETLQIETAIPEAHKLGSFTAIFSPDGKHIVTGGVFGPLKVWNSINGRLIETLHGHPEEIWSIAYSPDGTLIASGDNGGTIKIWNTAVEHEVIESPPTIHGAWTASINPEGTLLALSGKSGNPIAIWDTTQLREVFRIPSRHSDLVTALTFSPDGKSLASSSLDALIHIWNIETKPPFVTHVLKGHLDAVNSIRYSPDGHYIISGSSDKTIKVWKTDTGELTRTFTGHSNAVTSVQYTPDGTQVISGSKDKAVRIWDAQTGKCLNVYTEHESEINCIAISPDSTEIVSGDKSGTIILRDKKAGKQVLTLEGHSGGITDLTFSKDRRRIFSSSKDGFIRVWDTQTGQCLLTLGKYNTGAIEDIVLSPEGHTIFAVPSWRSVLIIYSLDYFKDYAAIKTADARAEYLEELHKSRLVAALVKDNPLFDTTNLKCQVDNNELVGVDISEGVVSNITALKGLPLENLNLSGTEVRDIGVLRGMPLVMLDLSGTPVQDIGILKGMTLENLNLSDTKISDINELRGMPLVSLDLGGIQIRDLNILGNTPLKYLVLPEIEGDLFSALKKMPDDCLVFEPDKVPVLAMNFREECISTKAGQRLTRNLAGNRGYGFIYGDETAGAKTKGLNFDGESNCVLMDEAFLNREPNWTLAVWVNPRERWLGSVYTEGTPPVTFSLSLNTWEGSLTVAIMHEDNPRQFVEATSKKDVVTSNAWNCIAIALQDGAMGEGELTAYVNGEQVLSTLGQMEGVKLTKYTSIGDNIGFHLGDRCPPIHFEGNAAEVVKYRQAPARFKGNIGELVIYHQVLSPEEIQNLYYMGARRFLPEKAKSNPLTNLGHAKQLLSKQLDKTIRKDNPRYDGGNIRLQIDDESQVVGLDLSGAPVSKIPALKGLPLQNLNLSGTKVTNISVLRGMPLARLNLGGAPVKDLGILKDMPLKYLVLPDAENDLFEVLKEIPEDCLVFEPDKVPVTVMNFSEECIFKKEEQRTVRNLAGSRGYGFIYGNEIAGDKTKGLNFDGKSNCVLMAEAVLNREPNWTLAVWIHPQERWRGDVYTEGNPPVTFSLSLDAWNGNLTVGMMHKDNPREFIHATSTKGVITSNAWNFVAITLQDADMDKGKLTAYVNGEQVLSTLGQMECVDATRYASVGDNIGFHVGYDRAPTHFHGNIAEVMKDRQNPQRFKGNIGELVIYHQVLSPEKIQNLYYMGARRFLPEQAKSNPLTNLGHAKLLHKRQLEEAMKRDNPRYDGDNIELEIDDEGQVISLDLSGASVSNIDALKGLPLKSLNLSGTQVSDIGVLRGMPLKYLVLPNEESDLFELLKNIPEDCLVFESDKVPVMAMNFHEDCIFRRVDHRIIRNLVSSRGDGFIYGNETAGAETKGLNFDGKSNCVLMGEDFLNREPNWTWTGWVYMSKSGEVPVYTEGNPGETFNIKLDANNGRLSVGMWHKDYPNNWMGAKSQEGVVTSDSWHFIAITLRDGAVGKGRLTAYVEGNKVLSTLGQMEFDDLLGRRNVSIGKNIGAHWGDNRAPITFTDTADEVLKYRENPKYFKGTIGEIVIYHQVLSQAEILKQYFLGARRFNPEQPESNPLTNLGHAKQLLKYQLEAALKGDNPKYGEAEMEFQTDDEEQVVDLSLSGADVSDINALKQLPLRCLDLSNTNVADITPLEAMPLSYLNLRGTQVRDISDLCNVPLACLDLGGTPLKDLSVLRRTSLRYLILPDETRDPLDVLTELNTVCSIYRPSNRPALLMSFDDRFFLRTARQYIVKDLSGSGNDGIISGAEMSGNAVDKLNFSAREDRIIIQRTVLNNVSNWTWTGWINPAKDSFCDEPRIYAEGNSGETFFVGVRPDEGCWIVGMWNKDYPGNWLGAQSGKDIVKFDQWNHIAITLQNGSVGQGRITFYVNGRLVSAAFGQTQNGPGSRHAAIGGKTGTPSKDGQRPFKGRLREIAIYRQALTPERIEHLYYMGARHFTPEQEDPFETSGAR